MSTPRRLFEDPRNTYIVENNDPGAFDKRFVGRPGVHREQRCCRDRAPVWQPHLIHDDDPGDGERPTYRKMDGLLVEDATGESDHPSGNNPKGMDWVEGPKSGYKPDFISAVEWMNWQSVYWIPSPHPVPGLPNPPRWIRLPGERKIRHVASGSYYEFLWCERCETWLEGAWSDILDAIPIAARGLAMIASYVPIYGTALSLAINTAVSLAEGESIDEALVDDIGRALPGQPTSGMVYKAGVAITRGERIEHAFIDTVIPDKSVADLLKAADQAIYSIANGQDITEAVYGTVQQYLPPEARQGMDLARRFIKGENVPEMILSQAEQVVADSVRNSAQVLLDEARPKGEAELKAAQARVDAMFNQYAVEFGYQMAVDRLAGDARQWIQLGMAGGAALTGVPEQFVGTFGSVPETNTAVNDSYEAMGKQLIAGGIRYGKELVSDILKKRTLSIVIDHYDPLNKVWEKRAMTYDMTDAWRRGFTIAIGVCDRSDERGPGQLAVYHTLAEAGGRGGFDAGQAIQFSRTEFHSRFGFWPEEELTSVAGSETRADHFATALRPDVATPLPLAIPNGPNETVLPDPTRSTSRRRHP